MPDVRKRLEREPAARIADVGCGLGWSTIGLARDYPLAHVDAFETDTASVELARRNIAHAGLADRAHVHQEDITTVSDHDGYDLVTVFECLHDLPHPTEALQAMHRMIKRGGTVLIADMKVTDRFTGPAGPVERLMYGFSLLVCLPDSMSHQDSAATGTVMRPHILRSLAEHAGFAAVELLPIHHDLWQFYRLHPVASDSPNDLR